MEKVKDAWGFADYAPPITLIIAAWRQAHLSPPRPPRQTHLTVCCHDIYDAARPYFIDTTRIRARIKVPFITGANMDLSLPAGADGGGWLT